MPASTLWEWGWEMVKEKEKERGLVKQQEAMEKEKGMQQLQRHRPRHM